MIFASPEMSQTSSNEMANSVDPDQTAPKRSSLVWVYTVCLNTSVPIFWLIFIKLRLSNFRKTANVVFQALIGQYLFMD